MGINMLDFTAGIFFNEIAVGNAIKLVGFLNS